jgi:hypothetical protein
MHPHDRLLERIGLSLPRQPALLENPDSIGQPFDIRHDVRRKDDCSLPIRGDLHQFLEKEPARHRIEARHRLIQHEQIRPVTKRAEDREFLPLADRHALDPRRAIHSPFHAEAVHELGIPARIERLRQFQLIICAQRVDELVLLRNEPDSRFDVSRHPATVMTEYAYVAAVGLAESQNQLEQRGLAGAVLAQHADHVTGPYLEREIVKNPFGPERLDQIPGLDR